LPREVIPIPVEWQGPELIPEGETRAQALERLHYLEDEIVKLRGGVDRSGKRTMGDIEIMEDALFVTSEYTGKETKKAKIGRIGRNLAKQARLRKDTEKAPVKIDDLSAEDRVKIEIEELPKAKEELKKLMDERNRLLSVIFTPDVVSELKDLELNIFGEPDLEHSVTGYKLEDGKFLRYTVTGEKEKFGFKVGSKLQPKRVPNMYKKIMKATELTIIGFTESRILFRTDNNYVFGNTPEEITKEFYIVS